MAALLGPGPGSTDPGQDGVIDVMRLLHAQLDAANESLRTAERLGAPAATLTYWRSVIRGLDVATAAAIRLFAGVPS